MLALRDTQCSGGPMAGGSRSCTCSDGHCEHEAPIVERSSTRVGSCWPASGSSAATGRQQGASSQWESCRSGGAGAAGEEEAGPVDCVAGPHQVPASCARASALLRADMPAACATGCMASTTAIRRAAVREPNRTRLMYETYTPRMSVCQRTAGCGRLDRCRRLGETLCDALGWRRGERRQHFVRPGERAGVDVAQCTLFHAHVAGHLHRRLEEPQLV